MSRRRSQAYICAARQRAPCRCPPLLLLQKCRHFAVAFVNGRSLAVTISETHLVFSATWFVAFFCSLTGRRRCRFASPALRVRVHNVPTARFPIVRCRLRREAVEARSGVAFAPSRKPAGLDVGTGCNSAFGPDRAARTTPLLSATVW